MIQLDEFRGLERGVSSNLTFVSFTFGGVGEVVTIFLVLVAFWAGVGRS